MISPLRVDDALAARVDALGPVSHIVAPSNLHHLFVGEAVARWPAARVHLPRGLPAKLAKQGRAVPPHSVLPAGLPSGVQGVLLEGGVEPGQPLEEAVDEVLGHRLVERADGPLDARQSLGELDEVLGHHIGAAHHRVGEVREEDGQHLVGEGARQRQHLRRQVRVSLARGHELVNQDARNLHHTPFVANATACCTAARRTSAVRRAVRRAVR